MSFNSIEYFLFLPAVFLAYWLVAGRSRKAQNLLVLCASYLFYGLWDWRFLALIAFTSFSSWLSGILIERYRDRRGKLLAVTNVLINLSVLGIFKYYDFYVYSFADMFLGGDTHGLLLKAVLPVGISFYTFQAVGYTIDVYRGKTGASHDLVEFFAFVSFFPQLVAGPIERASNLLPQFRRERVFDYAEAVDGMRQILWGLFKKAVVADGCAALVDPIFGSYQSQPTPILALAAVLFVFQIYGDFSGYSDVATGSAKLLGFRLMTNFRVPLFSRDIAEFWRRWHISLTTWFRDYIYIPLGGSRCSKARIVRNTFIVFLVSGMWHGAHFTFIVWGAYHALLFIPLILSGRNRRHLDTVACGRPLPDLKECAQMLLTFVLVTVGFVIFRAPNMHVAMDFFPTMLRNIHLQVTMTAQDWTSLTICFAALLTMLAVEWKDRNREHGLCMTGIKSPILRYAVYAILFIVVFFSMDNGSTFIYFQF